MIFLQNCSCQVGLGKADLRVSSLLESFRAGGKTCHIGSGVEGRPETGLFESLVESAELGTLLSIAHGVGTGLWRDEDAVEVSGISIKQENTGGLPVDDLE